MSPQEDVSILKNTVFRMYQFLKQFDDNALGDLYSFNKQLTMLIEASREELRNRCRMRPVNGWQLSEQKGIREIKDFASAYRVFADIMSQQEFESCCTVALTKLERIFTDYMMTKNPGISPDSCRQMFNDRVAPLVTYKPSREILMRTLP